MVEHERSAAFGVDQRVSFWIPLLSCAMVVLNQSILWMHRYFQYAGGFKPRKAFDITATGPDPLQYDPMFIMEAVKA